MDNVLGSIGSDESRADADQPIADEREPRVVARDRGIASRRDLPGISHRTPDHAHRIHMTVGECRTLHDRDESTGGELSSVPHSIVDGDDSAWLSRLHRARELEVVVVWVGEGGDESLVVRVARPVRLGDDRGAGRLETLEVTLHVRALDVPDDASRVRVLPRHLVVWPDG